MIKINVIDIEGEQSEIEAQEGDSLMNALGERVDAICGGCCSCGTCHVYIEKNSTDVTKDEISNDEKELVEFLASAKENSRLSCQIIINEQHDGMTITLAPEE
jgi:ferredoxin, 2Fe-2S